MRPKQLSRRAFTSGLAVGAACTALPRLGLSDKARASGEIVSLSDSWNVYQAESLVDAKVTLPHTPVALSWRNWDPASWQKVWTYRRLFELPPTATRQRLMLEVERALVNATVRVNGQLVATHNGGFLPFTCEITHAVHSGTNELEIEVDARWLDVPPAGSPKGPPAVDYYLPGGINGSVLLRILPPTAVVELRAQPRDVLSREPSLYLFAEIETDRVQEVHLEASLFDGQRLLRRSTTPVTLAAGRNSTRAELRSLRDIELWAPDAPRLYRVEVAIRVDNRQVHSVSQRIGFREARFALDGLYLNGKKTQLFGLNRHELFPYVGFAASPRAMRHDAAYLRHELNCNIVRCSHYPQSTAFLDACDELGLMVWEEIPGWQYLGDAAWKEIAVNNVADMIRRDRHHPSIIVWGTRINESANDPDLYAKTHALARELDPDRSTSGSMTPSSRVNWKEQWNEDVFAFDDYHAAPDGSVGIDSALPGVPYMLAEAVGQFSYGAEKNFLRRYRRAGVPEEQNTQALLHAQAHDRASQDKRNAGVIAWCGFDYASPMNAYAGVKCPGVVDTFRIPKLGASFYRAQVDPEKRIVLEPSFYWDSELHATKGSDAIFSNCDELRVFLDDVQLAVLQPDRENYPRLAYPPFFVELPWLQVGMKTLRIDGFIHGKRLISRSFDGNHARDELRIEADDKEIAADGADSTRIWFGVHDRFGNPRPASDGLVRVQHTGAGRLLGDDTFSMNEGAAAAVWLRSLPRQVGFATVTISHARLGQRSLTIETISS